MTEQFVVGIDIGGTNTVIGLVDKYARVLDKTCLKTQHYQTVDAYVDELCVCILNIIKNVGGEQIKGIGIGAPNGNFHTGAIEHAPNLRWKGLVPLAKLLEERLHLPVLLTNDANAAALGEMVYGAAVNVKDFIFITLGTGLGSGLVVDGKLVYGHDGFAGELGHVILFPDGRLCGCGNRGCLETYCSALGIMQTYFEFAQKHDIALPENKESLEAKYVYDRAIAGDLAALQAFEFTGELLGLALANSVKYTSPEVIFLFGGLSSAGDLLFAPMQKSFEKYLLPLHRGKIKLLKSALEEGKVAILGAASLIWQMK
jgi:glucokinase